MNETLAQFLSLYPRKDDNTAIWLEWNRQVGSGHMPDEILAGTRAWVGYWQTALTATQFIPKPVAFLRSKQYLDLPSSITQGAKRTWTPPAVPTRRWTAGEANEPKISAPLKPPTYEAPKPREGFRTAADILASHRSKPVL